MEMMIEKDKIQRTIHKKAFVPMDNDDIKKNAEEPQAEEPKKAEPKHDKKPAQTAEKQICSLYLPTETLNKINNFKGFLNISAGDMVSKAVEAWEEKIKGIAEYIAKGQALKEQVK